MVDDLAGAAVLAVVVDWVVVDWVVVDWVAVVVAAVLSLLLASSSPFDWAHVGSGGGIELDVC